MRAMTSSCSGEPWLSAIGDVVALAGQPHPQLAHLASAEGIFVIEKLAGLKPHPIRYDLVEQYRLSGKVLEWTWVRRFSPFINTYAFVFLVGLAIRSAWHFARKRETWHRVVGNVYIAVGGLLPGIGGTFTRFGHVEVLYVTEFVGLALIFVGYRYSVAGRLLPEQAGPIGLAATG